MQRVLLELLFDASINLNVRIHIPLYDICRLWYLGDEGSSLGNSLVRICTTRVLREVNIFITGWERCRIRKQLFKGLFGGRGGLRNGLIAT